MSGFLLHEGAAVTCLHGGRAQPSVVKTRVRVSGEPAVAQDAAWSVVDCALPASAGGPCATAHWLTGAARLRSDGAPLLLADSQAVCAPTGTGVHVVVTQERVRGA
jgi:hypothetical protein